MALLPYTALAELGPEDAVPQGFLDTVSNVNFVNETIAIQNAGTEVASDYKVKDYVEDFLWDIVRRCKTRRLPLEDEWLEIQRMVVLDHDSNQRYRGNSRAYVPLYARARKTLVSNLTRGLFPSDDLLDVTDREQGDTEEAKAVKMVTQFELEQSGLRRTIKNFLGQYVDFGVSCLKGFYRSNRIIKGGKGVISPTIQPGTEGGNAYQETYDEGVTWSTRSMFNIVVYPEWAESKRELQLEAERLEVPISYVNEMHASKRWLNVEEALKSGSNHNDNFDWVNTSTLADVASIPNTFELRGRDGSPAQAVIIVEVWTSMVVPDKYYGPGERKGSAVPVQCVMVNGTAVKARRNPYHHQCSPFLYARDNEIAGSFYGNGSGRLMKHMQYQANDTLNQVNDCATYAMNPVTTVNTNYFAGAIDALKPGRVYKTRDNEKAIKFWTPPMEPIQYGTAHFQTLMSVGQDGGGAPPVLQGAKSASTATSTQVLANNASGPLQDAVEDIEADVMVPAAEMTWELSKQYRDVPFQRTFGKKVATDQTGAPIIDPATGQPAIIDDVVKFLPSDIDIAMNFRFLSSSQAANRSQRQQGLMAFTELAEKLQPNLQAMGKMLNPEPILRRAWNDGLGHRGFDKVVVAMPPPPPMGVGGQGMPPGGQGVPPGGPGQTPPAPVPPPVSAVPQGNVPGAANNEPAQGEDIRSMRQQVEAETAKLGPLAQNAAPRHP